MARPKRRGIFCLETIWYDSKDQTSIRPALELLRDSYLKVPFIHRNAVTADAFEYHVAEWLDLGREFPILYLGYHGEAGELQLHDKSKNGSPAKSASLSLREVADIFRGLGGCEDRLVHFASCSTLNQSDKDLGSLVDVMGASAISGYCKEVYWVASTAFEMIYLESLQYGGKTKALSKDVMQSVKEGDDNHHWPLFEKKRCGPPLDEFSNWLGFRLQVRE